MSSKKRTPEDDDDDEYEPDMDIDADVAADLYEKSGTTEDEIKAVQDGDENRDDIFEMSEDDEDPFFGGFGTAAVQEDDEAIESESESESEEVQTDEGTDSSEEEEEVKEEEPEEEEEEEEEEENGDDQDREGPRIPYNTKMGKLEELLKDLKTSSQFYCTGTRELAMPSVTVEGVGRLSFPIPDVQIEKLIADAKRAPFGRREKTLTDLTVRKVWQLPAEAVTVTGNAWKTTFDEILRTVRAFPFKGSCHHGFSKSMMALCQQTLIVLLSTPARLMPRWVCRRR